MLRLFGRAPLVLAVLITGANVPIDAQSAVIAAVTEVISRTWVVEQRLTGSVRVGSVANSGVGCTDPWRRGSQAAT